MENPSNYSSNATYLTPRGSSGFKLENPFTFKVGQVFTGFGVGCGVGIGIGKPIYLGAIPMLQPVLSAARGATDVFSGVGHHVNSSLKKLGAKNIEAGIGCGVGIGHGFGVGIALKPGVANRALSSLGQALAKMNINLGAIPGLSSVQTAIPGSNQGSATMFTPTTSRRMEASGSILDSASKAGENSTKSYDSNINASGRSTGSHSEKIINKFLGPLLKDEDGLKLEELAGKLRSENNVLQLLIKHQGLIEELMEENRKLHKLLVEDLKIEPSRLEAVNASTGKIPYSCKDCFECRRRSRKSAR